MLHSGDLMVTVVCKGALKQVLGKKVTDAKVRNVEKILSRKMRELARTSPEWQGLTARERIVAGADQAVRELRAKEQEVKRRAILQIQAKRSNRLTMETLKQPKKNWATALVDRLDQVYNTQQTLFREMFSRSKVALDEVADGDFYAWLQNPKNVLAFVRELDGVKTTNKTAAKVSKTWSEFTEMMRQRVNRSGANVGKLDYGYIPRTHDNVKIQKIGDDANGRNQWVEDTLPLLKREYYLREDGSAMTDDELRAFLRQVKTTLDTDGLNKIEPGQRRGTGVGSARLGNQHRELHLTADGWVQYNAKYGRGTLLEAIQGHIHRMSRDTALFEEMGSNPEATYQYLNDIAKTRDNGEQTAGIGGFYVLPDEMWATVSGVTGRPVNQSAAQIQNNIVNTLVSARLGKAFLSAVSDFGSTFVTARYNKLPAMRVYLETMRAAGKEGQEAAKLHGLIAESMIGDGNKFILDNLTENWSAKVANATLRISGLHAMTDAIRRGHSIVHMQALGEMRATNWKDLDSSDLSRLQEHNITESDWSAWQKANLDDWRGTSMLTATGIRKLSDTQIRETIKPRINDIGVEADIAVRKLMQRNAQDAGWVAAREGRLTALTQELEAKLKELETDKSEQASKAKDYIRTQIDALEADRDFSRVRSMVDEEALTDEFATRLRVREYLKAKGKPDAGVKTFGGAQVAVGKKLGAKEIAARTRVKEANARIRKIDKTTRDYLDQKFGQIEKRLLVQRKALNDFTRRSEARQQQRDLAIRSVLERAENQIADEVLSARDKTTTKYLSFINDESHYASIAPDALARSAITRGTRPGSAKGILFRVGGLFATFPLSMVTRHWRRASKLGWDNGQAGYLVSLIASHTLLGAVSVQSRNVIFGKDPEDMTTFKFWIKSLIYGGALGWIGDTIEAIGGVVSRYRGQPDLGSTLGAGAAVVGDVLAPIGSGVGAVTGENRPETFYQDIYRAAKGFVPFSNIWWLEGALNHMLLHDLQDAINPGYLQRMERNTKKNQGVDYFWRPGEALPRRAPDLESAIGE